MKNKWVRVGGDVLLSGLCVIAGEIITGLLGKFIFVLGGLALIYGIVEATKSPKNQAASVKKPK